MAAARVYRCSRCGGETVYRRGDSRFCPYCKEGLIYPASVDGGILDDTPRNRGENKGKYQRMIRGGLTIAAVFLTVVALIVFAKPIHTSVPVMAHRCYYGFSPFGGILQLMFFIFLAMLGFRIWAIKKCLSILREKGYSKNAGLVVAFVAFGSPLLALLICWIL